MVAARPAAVRAAAAKVVVMAAVATAVCGGGGGADKEKPSRGSAKRGRDGSKPGKAGN